MIFQEEINLFFRWKQLEFVHRFKVFNPFSLSVSVWHLAPCAEWVYIEKVKCIPFFSICVIGCTPLNSNPTSGKWNFLKVFRQICKVFVNIIFLPWYLRKLKSQECLSDFHIIHYIWLKSRNHLLTKRFDASPFPKSNLRSAKHVETKTDTMLSVTHASKLFSSLLVWRERTKMSSISNGSNFYNCVCVCLSLSQCAKILSLALPILHVKSFKQFLVAI